MIKAQAWPSIIIKLILLVLALLAFRLDYPDQASITPPEAALALSQSPPNTPPPLPPSTDRRSWDRYRTFLWLHGDCQRSEALASALRSLGVEGANVYGNQPVSEWAARYGLPFYVDHLAGKGDLYLARAEWQKAWDHYWSTRDPAAFVRPRCLNDPAVMGRLKENIRQRILLHKSHGPLAYALDDELSITSFANPFDFCFCPFCLTRFRAGLQKSYAGLEALNKVWETNFAAWAEVKPFTTDAMRRREFNRPAESFNFAPWIDHRAFMDDVLASTLNSLIAYAHEFDSETPVGFTGGQAPSAFGGYDWWKLMQIVEFLEPYDLGGSREIIRSFNARGIPIVQTLFVGASQLHETIWRLWYYLAHGDRGVILWSSREYFHNQDAHRPTARAQALAATLRELAALNLAPMLGQARVEADGIAIYYSQPSLQVHWMLDSRADGDTWPKRFGSYEVIHSSILKTMQAWQKVCEDLGFQYDYLSSQQVLEGVLSQGSYRLLILPKTIALSDAEAVALERFVRSGGAIIADYQTGLMDEHGRSRAVGALDALFGIRRRDRRVTENYGDGAPVSAVRAGHFQSLPLAEPGLVEAGATARAKINSVPCVFTRPVERGMAVYLNLAMMRYASARAESDHGLAVRQFIGSLLRERGLRPQVTVTHGGKELPYCERIFYRQADRRYLFLVLNQQDIRDPGKLLTWTPKRIPILLQFNTPVRLKNLRTGQALGMAASFADTFATHEANIYELSP